VWLAQISAEIYYNVLPLSARKFSFTCRAPCIWVSELKWNIQYYSLPGMMLAAQGGLWRKRSQTCKTQRYFCSQIHRDERPQRFHYIRKLKKYAFCNTSEKFCLTFELRIPVKFRPCCRHWAARESQPCYPLAW